MDIIIAFGVLAALFLGVTIVVNKPVVGFVAIGTFSAIASDFPQLPAVVRVVGLNIYPGDGIAVIVLLAALVHPRSSVRRSTIISLLAISIVGLAFLNLLRGASDFGLSASVNESR
ncbi:MAG TPA: hypothetical protein VJ846_01875, partial [Sphingomicrobium sp.]|nr:hypothetical protein [Sphingomicrobium sp.]